jgi:hypothetical protein
VQELISQRASWLKTQHVLEHDLTEIERRFVRSHTQLQERLRAFETRTDELERALAAKTEENTELIKTHIAMAQQTLAKQTLNPKKGDEEEVLWN